MANDSIRKTVTVAILLCIVCSVLVSTAAVKLRPIQERNKQRYTRLNIVRAAGMSLEGTTVDQLFEKIEVKYVDLSNGEFVTDINEKSYSLQDALRNPESSVTIKDENDLAGIGKRAKTMVVYLVREEGEISTVILPVYGKGLWSTMYAFLALESDGNTIKGLKFYDHGETPGLGGEIDNPEWQEEWEGKKIYDENMSLEIEVLKGNVDESKPQSIHQVDGLSGATLTTKGVSNMFRYWFGSDGYKKFLSNIRGEGA